MRRRRFHFPRAPPSLSLCQFTRYLPPPGFSHPEAVSFLSWDYHSDHIAKRGGGICAPHGLEWELVQNVLRKRYILIEGGFLFLVFGCPLRVLS